MKQQVHRYVTQPFVLPHKINCSTNSPCEFNLSLIPLCFRFLAIKGYTLGNVIIRKTHQIHDLRKIGEPPSLRVSGTSALMRKVFGITDPALVHRGGGVIFLNSLSTLFSLGGQPWTSLRVDFPGIGNIFKKQQKILTKDSMSQELLYLFSSSSWIWPTTCQLELVLSLQTAEERAERVATGRWAELDQLSAWHSSVRACFFSYLTFILAPLQHRTQRMGFTLPNCKCLQRFVSSRSCSDVLYLRKKTLPCLLWREYSKGLRGRALEDRPSQAGWVPAAQFCLGNTLLVW